MTEEWQTALERQREQKEQYFASHPQSPIPDSADFAGLDHYPPDLAYRFELELHEHEQKERVTVETTADGSQEYVRHGEFRFEIDGEPVTLQAYKPAGGGDRLWVPFRDETNDEETYGAGRYIDLEPEDHRTENGTWILDLNQAYNPTCAYNEAYECPLIPMENWLDIPVEVGERAYPGEPVGHHHH